MPDWEPFSWKNGFVQIVFAEVPCNWLQCQENSIDPLHFEWMHMNWSVRLEDQARALFASAPRSEFEEFDYGFVYRRLREGMKESDPMWTTGRVCLWPNALFPGDHFEWRVPMDDENTLSVTWAFTRVPREHEPYVQDGSRVAWTREGCFGRLDLKPCHESGFRRVDWPGTLPTGRRSIWVGGPGRDPAAPAPLDDLTAIGRGEDPKGVIRDPIANDCVRLPVAERRYLTESLTRDELLKHPVLGKQYQGEYPFQAGQPDDVRKAYAKAMGISISRTDRDSTQA